MIVLFLLHLKIVNIRLKYFNKIINNNTAFIVRLLATYNQMLIANSLRRTIRLNRFLKELVGQA
jgi:hypothetical protein